MAAPISYSSINLSNATIGRGSAYQVRTTSKQSQPYDLPTTYLRRQGYMMAADAYGGYTLGAVNKVTSVKSPWQLAWGPDFEEHFPNEIARSRNSAYEKFREAVKDDAMVLVNIAERQQALNGIVSAAQRLADFTVGVIRRNPKLIGRALNAKPTPLTRKLGNAHDLWLEYHFGWEPLIKDIGTSIEILQSPVHPKVVKVRGKPENFGIVWTRQLTATQFQAARIVGNCRTSCSAGVIVTNPSLFRANQLGFVNPAGVAWELVPFSFVVDWFVPVSTFLNEMTDWLGLSFNNASYFTKLATPNWWAAEYTKKPAAPRGFDQVSMGFWATRTLGIPSVTLVPRRVTGLSPSRAATSVALLLQQLEKVK